MADPGGERGWGAYDRPLFVVFFFYNSEDYQQNISIEQVRNAGNAHFRDSNFQQFLEDIASVTPTKLTPLALVVPPPKSPGSAPDL